MSDVWAGCPKFGQDVRSFGRVSEVWAGCPKFEQGFRSLGRMSKVRACYPRDYTEEQSREGNYKDGRDRFMEGGQNNRDDLILNFFFSSNQ